MKLYLGKLVLFLFLAGCATKPLPKESMTKLPPVPQPQVQAKNQVAAPAPAQATLPKPVVVSPLVKIDHGYFQVYYHPRYRLPQYVVYTLTAEQVQKSFAKRKNNFRVDPLLEKQNLPIATPAEYFKSGYDQGHMAPAADFSWKQEASDASFFMSNIAPQKAGLNRVAWKKLEEKVRRWACGEEKITVITGPVLKNNLPRLVGGLTVPHEFFKIIIDETSPRKAVAFIYNQEDSKDVLLQRQVQIQNVAAWVAPEALNFPQERGPSSLDGWKEKDCRPKKKKKAH